MTGSKQEPNWIEYFDHQPTDEELSVALGVGLFGTSSTHIHEIDEQLLVQPKPIPVRAVSIWLYLVWAGMGFVLAMTEQRGDIVFWTIWVLAALIIHPTMIAMFNFINQGVGPEPYLIYDKVKKTITLPRISLTVGQVSAQKLIFVDRYVNGNRIFQVSLLCRSADQWTYAHLYNAAGTEQGWLVSGLSQQIASKIGIESRHIKLNRNQSLLVDSKG